jgi:glucose dehydrogenase
MPCQQPPWGHLVAVNVNTGDIAWNVPLGTFNELEAKGIHNTGAPNMGGSIVTAGGLVFIGATNDSRFRAFDSRTGKELWVTKIDASAHAVPMTYQGRDGKQYVAIMANGGGIIGDHTSASSLIAFALP